MKKLTSNAAALALLVVLFSSFTQAVNAQYRRYSLRVENRSSFIFREIYMSHIEDPNWRRDLLGNDVLMSGEATTLYNIAAGEYDIMVVDEDGDKCIIQSEPIFSNRVWALTDQKLLRCEGY